MESVIEVLQQPWATRALLASSMVGVMCGILGCFIVLRNMALVGDAIAHAILPGVVFAFMLVGQSALGFFAGAVIAGLVMAVGITWIQQKVTTKNDAAIGIVFTAMFSIGVIGISSINRRPGVHLDLKDFLFGNVLGVSNEDLYLTLGVLIYVLISVILFYRYLFATTFQPIIAQTMGISVQTIHYFLMLMLAFAVVASLRTVGVILVVAMLITPASTALLLSNQLRKVLVIAGAIGLLSAILGLILAIIFETTPGPAMAIVATILYLVAVLFAPEKGLVFKFFRKQQLQKRIRLEDIIKQSHRLEERGELSLAALLEKLEFGETRLNNHLRELRTKKYVEKNSLNLTPSGRKIAEKMIRAHRLWETYLVEKMGLSEHQIHEDAEKYEHLLSEELLDEVDYHLGYPTTDPHGSPIPSRRKLLLSQLAVKQVAVITHKQISNIISAKLWDLGILPEMPIELKAKQNGTISVKQEERVVEVPLDLAEAVSVKTV
ncbi:MAG: iron chelate uptake ABC transporter family permease subunit [Bacteroidota bacterium]